jgi:hypothetical protein
MLARSASGRFEAAIVEGEAGIGKSSLFAKLGLSTRTELAAEVARRSPSPSPAPNH